MKTVEVLVQIIQWSSQANGRADYMNWLRKCHENGQEMVCFATAEKFLQ